jgi:hypothetical protein
MTFPCEVKERLPNKDLQNQKKEKCRRIEPKQRTIKF